MLHIFTTIKFHDFSHNSELSEIKSQRNILCLLNIYKLLTFPSLIKRWYNCTNNFFESLSTNERNFGHLIYQIQTL